MFIKTIKGTLLNANFISEIRPAALKDYQTASVLMVNNRSHIIDLPYGELLDLIDTTKAAVRKIKIESTDDPEPLDLDTPMYD